MRLKELHVKFHNVLGALFDKEEINSFFFILTEDFFGINRLQLALQPAITITTQEAAKLTDALEELQKERPVQYITGKAYFYELVFGVNEYTLIPRPETEELVQWVLDDCNTLDFEGAILDIGTGSGCIAISLAYNLPKASVTAVDISDGALQMAAENAKRNNVTVSFRKEDALAVNNPFFKECNKLDILVSNPPYVRELEKQEIKNNVLQYEPGTALFVPDANPLLFYDSIANIALDALKDEGVLYFEINQYLGEETRELLLDKGFKNVELRKDIYGNDRMIKAVKPA